MKMAYEAGDRVWSDSLTTTSDIVMYGIVEKVKYIRGKQVVFIEWYTDPERKRYRMMVGVYTPDKWKLFHKEKEEKNER